MVSVVRGETIPLGACAKAGIVAKANKIPEITNLFDNMGNLLLVRISISAFRERHHLIRKQRGVKMQDLARLN